MRLRGRKHRRPSRGVDAEDFEPEAFDEFAAGTRRRGPNFISRSRARRPLLHAGQGSSGSRSSPRPTRPSVCSRSNCRHFCGIGGDVRGSRCTRTATTTPPASKRQARRGTRGGGSCGLTGRFLSEELETFYAFTVEDGDLVLHQRRLDRAELEPGEEDQFSGGGLSFAFERDRNGQVIGFYVANGRTRDVRFGRVR